MGGRPNKFPGALELADVLETYYSHHDGEPLYEVVNSKYGVIHRPFYITVKGAEKLAVIDKESGHLSVIYARDVGLIPMISGLWNEANSTHLVGPSWADDWM